MPGFLPPGWKTAAGSGLLARRARGGDVLSKKVVWQLIKPYAESAGVSGIARHDLRRTCAKLCGAGGGVLEQIQMLLGHASVQPTERYLGTRNDWFTRGTMRSKSASRNRSARTSRLLRKLQPANPHLQRDRLLRWCWSDTRLDLQISVIGSVEPISP